MRSDTLGSELSCVALGMSSSIPVCKVKTEGHRLCLRSLGEEGMPCCMTSALLTV